MINFFGAFELDAAIVVCIVAGLAIIASILSIVNILKMKKLRRSYNRFMMGKDTESMEDMIYQRFNEIDELKKMTEKNRRGVAKLNTKMLRTYQKFGVHKYDAFQEMGGKLSFALCMLTESDNGWLLNAMHSREGCYTYVKEIVGGKSFIELSEDEKVALDQALAGQGDVDLGDLNKEINK